MNKILLLFLYAILIPYSQLYAQNDGAFRGVWVATVANIDWPSENNLNPEQQRQEFIKLLDKFKETNLNTVIFQIRPSADAFYNSKFEPWSAYLTGINGKAPQPYYDPLAFMIEETHKRGMEFHAWINPYRAIVKYKEYHENPPPITYNKPEWFINYGENKYFDPGNPDVQNYTVKVITDIVQQYDIDAIHLDDYFYPYKIKDAVFPDSLSFKTYGNSFYPDKLADWRRNNVNSIIEKIHSNIKLIKPWVQFGISPFGVWRNKTDDPKGSDTQAGQTNYDDLYADVLLWIEKGWLDYVIPQAYWHIGHKKADFESVVRWWAGQNLNQTNLYAGLGLYRLNRKKENRAWRKKRPNEIEKQLNMLSSLPAFSGEAYFSARIFMENPFNIGKILTGKYYKTPVIPPVVKKNHRYIPEPVYSIKSMRLNAKNYRISWKRLPENAGKQAVKFLVYQFNRNEKVDIYNPGKIIALTSQTFIDVKRKLHKKGSVFAVVAVNRSNHKSKPVIFKVP